MESLLNNSWFIGIMTGLISTLVSTLFVFSITYIFTTIMYKKRLESANQFMIEHLRPFILKGIIPSDTLTNALRKNTAKRFRVKEIQLPSLSGLVAEIAAEIVDSSYLEETSRIQYLNTINTYLSDHMESNDDLKKSMRKMLCISLLTSSCVSSFILTGIIEFMRVETIKFNDILVAVQGADDAHIILLVLLMIEFILFTYELLFHLIDVLFDGIYKLMDILRTNIKQR